MLYRRQVSSSILLRQSDPGTSFAATLFQNRGGTTRAISMTRDEVVAVRDALAEFLGRFADHSCEAHHE